MPICIIQNHDILKFLYHFQTFHILLYLPSLYSITRCPKGEFRLCCLYSPLCPSVSLLSTHLTLFSLLSPPSLPTLPLPLPPSLSRALSLSLSFSLLFADLRIFSHCSVLLFLPLRLSVFERESV